MQEDGGRRPGSRRPPLHAVVLRGAALFLVLLLVWNPPIPGADPAFREAGLEGPRSWLLVDPHPLLGLELEPAALTALARELGAQGVAVVPPWAEGPDGGTPLLEVGTWESPPDLRGLTGPRGPGSRRTPGAREPASGQQEGVAEGQEGGALVAQGEVAGPEGAAPVREGLAPVSEALAFLAEAGGSPLSLLSALRGDPASLVEVLANLSPLPVTLRVPETGVANAGILRLELRRDGARLAGEALVGAEGLPEGARVRLFLEVEKGEGHGEPVAWAVPLAPWDRSTREAAVPFEVPLPDPPARGRLRARVALEGLEGVERGGGALVDGWPLDDTLEVDLPGDDGDGGLLLLSVRPDPEPQLLLPFLERATGLEGAGWLQVAPDRFVALHDGGAGLQVSDAAGLADRIREARLLVLQGPLAGTGAGWATAWPAPWRAPLAAHSRRLHLATADSPSPAGGPPVRVDPEFPPSPLRAFLVGTLDAPEAAGLAPLLPRLGSVPLPGGAEGVAGGPAGVVGLHLRVGGERLPGVRLLALDDTRVVEVGVEGGWRWGLRDDAAAAFWRGLWGGAAAWVMGGEGAAGENPGGDAGAAGPPGGEGEGPFARGTARRSGGETVAVAEAPHPLLAPVPPAELVEALTVRGVPATLLDGERRPADISDPSPWGVRVGAPVDEARDAYRPVRPLRSHPAPWLLVAGLLSLAWLLGRRAGLR